MRKRQPRTPATAAQLQEFMQRIHQATIGARERRIKELEAMGQRLCSHIKQNGAMCEAVALRDSDCCYFHHRTRERERKREKLGGPTKQDANTGIEMPLLEDNNSIQVALQQVLEALLDRRIDSRRAALILYGLQTAIGNLRRTRFQPYESERVLLSLA
jgi:hypothetical protein